MIPHALDPTSHLPSTKLPRTEPPNDSTESFPQTVMRYRISYSRIQISNSETIDHNYNRNLIINHRKTQLRNSSLLHQPTNWKKNRPPLATWETCPGGALSRNHFPMATFSSSPSSSYPSSSPILSSIALALRTLPSPPPLPLESGENRTPETKKPERIGSDEAESLSHDWQQQRWSSKRWLRAEGQPRTLMIGVQHEQQERTPSSFFVGGALVSLPCLTVKYRSCPFI